MSEKRFRLAHLMALLFLLGSLGGGGYCLLHLSQAQHLPWDERVSFFFPYLTAADHAGRSYVVDTATRRLVALEADGTLRWIREGGQRTGGFYYAHGLAVDAKDRLYVYNWVPQPGADYKAQEIQIQRYRGDGSSEKTVFQAPNTANDDSFPGSFAFFIAEDHLFTLLGDGKVLSLTRYGLEGGTPTVVRSLPTDQDFVAIAGTSAGRLAGAARDGSLWEAPPGQPWKRLDLPGVKKPWDLKFQADGRLLILDLLRGAVVRREADGALTEVLTSAKTGGVFADTIALSPGGTLAVADKELQRLLVSRAPGQFQAFQGAALSPADRVSAGLFWGLAVVAVVCFLLFLGTVYFFIVHRRLPLLFIQLVLFVPIILLVQTFAFTRVYDVLSQRYRGQVKSTLMNTVQLTARILPKDAVQVLKEPSDFGTPAYEALKAAAKDLQRSGQESGAFSYMAIYRLVGGKPHYVYTASGTFGVDYPYTLLPRDALALFQTPGQTYSEYFDDYGVYNAAFASLVGADGRPLGVVEVGIYADLAKDVENASLSTAVQTAVISGVLFIAVFVVLTLLLLRSLNVLRRMTREISQGKVELGPPLKNRDESGQLSRDFEVLSGRLQEYLGEITALTAASARFVPRDFIDLLGVEELTELKLGDQTSRDMTVLFSSVQNFPKLTGQFTSQGMFKFLNTYLSTVAPLIRTNSGAIDKYIGDTYMALFPRGPGDALRAWVQIQRKLKAYNQKRRKGGSEELRFSFGIHRGPLMMGIVGETERMEGTVISDSVNLTSRINGLCKRYGVSCVVSQATLDLIDPAEAPPFRPLDYVVVKGKTDALLVSQPLDPGDPENHGLLKALPVYRQAFQAWTEGRVADAEALYQTLEAQVPADPVIRMHRERCAAVLREGLPEVWNPGVKVGEK